MATQTATLRFARFDEDQFYAITMAPAEKVREAVERLFDHLEGWEWNDAEGGLWNYIEATAIENGCSHVDAAEAIRNHADPIFGNAEDPKAYSRWLWFLA